MAIVLSGTTNDITVNGVSVATDTDVSSAVANGVATKANTADLKEIGVGQTWQNVTGSRTAGITYTNNTGKPIAVCIVGGHSTAGSATFLINSTIVKSIPNISGVPIVYNFDNIIPNNTTYGIGGVANIQTWSELR